MGIKKIMYYLCDIIILYFLLLWVHTNEYQFEGTILHIKTVAYYY